MDVVDELLDEKFAGKKALLRVEPQGARAGLRLRAASTSTARCRSTWRRWTPTDDKILIDGNTATALGCLYAGATVAAWYPITPSTSVMDAFKSFCEKYRKDPETGKNNYCILQAEDELAAIGMVIGASLERRARLHLDRRPRHLADERALGLAYYAEIPAVIVDVQRIGPSTGMPTRTQQGDILVVRLRLARRHQAHPAVPGEPGECFDFAVSRVRPGRALPDAGVHALRSRHRHERLGRARASTGTTPIGPTAAACSTAERARGDARSSTATRPRTRDHVAARTLPGVHPKGAFFTRGSGHNKLGGYTEIPDEYQEVMDRLLRKHTAAAPGRAGAGDRRSSEGARSRHRHRSAAATPAVREALEHPRRAGHRRRLHARARLPVRRRASRRSSTRTSAASSSSRTATRSCARC